MSRFRGLTKNNVSFVSKVIVRRSIDLRELADFGTIEDSASDLPTAGATHRAGTSGSKSSTRQYTDLQGLFDTVVDNQDMGSITATARTTLGYNDEPYKY